MKTAAVAASALVILSACAAQERGQRVEPLKPNEKASEATVNAYVSWSTDGRKVLLMEAVRAGESSGTPVMAPRRLVAFALEPGHALREVWSHGAETPEARAAAKPEAAAQGFETANPNWPRLENRPPMKSGEGTDVVLAGGGWIARLDGRKTPAPAWAYPSPTGKHAFVIPDERVVSLTPGIHFDLLPGWRQIEQIIPTYVNEARGGASLQATLQYGVVPPNLPHSSAVTQVAAGYGWTLQGGLTSGRCSFGDWVAGAFRDGNMHIHAWFLFDGSDLGFVTFIGTSPPSPPELESVTRMALSARRATVDDR
jgi:hypothetical protein